MMYEYDLNFQVVSVTKRLTPNYNVGKYNCIIFDWWYIITIAINVLPHLLLLTAKKFSDTEQYNKNQLSTFYI